MFAHLTAHSAYSLQEGLATPTELAQAAKAQGMPALGMTDHNLLTGAVEFVHACKKAEIQPLLGLEIDLSTGRLPLLATSQEGWANLCRLSSALALQDDPEEPCSLDLLVSLSNDLIAIGSAGGKEEARQFETLKDIFSNRLYLSLQDPRVGLPLSSFARSLGVQMVVTHPIYYLKPEQASLQRTLTAIRLNQPLNTLSDEDLAPAGAYFLSQGEMLRRFHGFQSALKQTQEIAERCTFDLSLGEPNMPQVPIPNGLTPSQYLRQKAESGAKKRYGKITPDIQARLDHELETIATMGYEPIFLIVEDVLNFARETGVPYSSRGSAASSLVAHCLGITSPDPLRLNLYFERFLNPARQTPPDIDTDLCSVRRDSVIRHVFEKYGEEQVAMVGTINRFRSRSALGEVAKAYGLAPKQVRAMAEKLPHSFWARSQERDEDGQPVSPFNFLRELYPGEKYKQIFDDAEAILKLPRHLSMHPGGLVVAPGPVTDLVPVMRSGGKGVIITQLDLDAVEEFGLVKIDLLGIRGLSVLGDVAEFIQQDQPERYPSSLSVLDSTPVDDKQVSDLIEQGKTIGCFQIESPGMRATLREIHAKSTDDIMAALALYRPGPLTGGLKDAFVRRFKGEEEIHHLHPSLAPLLDETFGVILYQEQVLRIAHELAGFSLAEADLLRRAMSHFDPGKRMQELQRKFVSEAEARSGILQETGERVWEMMAAFAGYGFPKAHAASYAQIAWRSAWAKVHFPAEFMAAVLANWGGYYSQRVYLSEARQLGLTVRAPHINHSLRNFAVASVSGEKQLFMGLGQIKHLTRRTIEKIIYLRPYRSLDDFLTRVDPRSQEAENLVKVGALDGLGSIPALLQRLKGGWQAGQMSLFAINEDVKEDWSLEERMVVQQEILGVSLAAHPLELVADQIEKAGAVAIVDAVERISQRVTVAGVRQASRRSRTAKGETMLFLTLEDLSGTLDVIVFPDLYKQVKQIAISNHPMLITGVLEIDRGREEPSLKAEKIERVLR
ncbi:MAG: DNA polymerase III subunit alpha [Anaerolineales bacterium]|uniref:DNA-directed DNA polymerase n=1 Tax=Candidatus Desulfolinea nitratireducens TaxID=2841698 RepID=A0A8J6NHA3_9CHLR|nr:DNA polymerase III subunit alpha [Candidatus Desulfolinea nitratireducens]